MSEEPVAIIGLGLIGGSLARDLAAAGVPVLGHDRDPRTVAAALEAGAISAALDASMRGLDQARVVVLAVPVDAAVDILRCAAPHLDRATLVTDVGSTKEAIVEAAERVGLADRFVGGHPMAGDDRSGWSASRRELFRGARVFLCPTPASSGSALDRADRLWRLVGATPLRVDAREHDHRLAWTSHLPQLLATTLAIALNDAGIKPAELGAGGRSMTRLAASTPEMWAGIASRNAPALSRALEGLDPTLARFRGALAARDQAALGALFSEGRHWTGASVPGSPEDQDAEGAGTTEAGGPIVAFQGELGAHSEDAVRGFFPDPVRAAPCREFRDVVEAVSSGRAVFGLLPVENSTAGSIVAAYDLLARSGLEVVGEIIRSVRHCLVGLPGASVGRIRRVLSHPVALAQCGIFLAERPWIEAVASYDTAGAARVVSRGDDPAVTAIASRHAADHYGLDVLAADIQDRPDNRTRFLVLARPGTEAPERGARFSATLKSALFIDVADRPGSLAEVLLPFARRAVNLSHIQSTPGEAPWTYRFIVELEGDAGAGAPAAALGEARAVGAHIRILGRYRSAVPHSSHLPGAGSGE